MLAETYVNDVLRDVKQKMRIIRWSVESIIYCKVVYFSNLWGFNLNNH